MPFQLPSALPLLSLALLVVLTGCPSEDPFPSFDEETELRNLAAVRRPPRSATNRFADDPRAASLGQRLFFDEGLSGCGTVSCASCHPTPDYVDGERTSKGCSSGPARHTPTLLNVAFSHWYMWDGRADSLWSQAMLPLFDPHEMAADAEALPAYLSAQHPQYAELFGHDPATHADRQEVFANVGKSLEAYVRTLVEVEAPFDERLAQFLRASEEGRAEEDPFYLPLKTFLREGRCIACHKGPMLTDQEFHNIGLADPRKDEGRIAARAQVAASPFNGAGLYSDDRTHGQIRLDALAARKTDDEVGAFKTPTLRNVSRTAPYMHTGAVQTLDEVIDLYDRGGDETGTFAGVRTESIAPLSLTAEQKAALRDLLDSLSPAP